MTSTPAHAPVSPFVAPPGRRVSPGGVLYVGPSLTRSLLGVAVALRNASA